MSPRFENVFQFSETENLGEKPTAQGQAGLSRHGVEKPVPIAPFQPKHCLIGLVGTLELGHEDEVNQLNSN